ncbi:MAG: prepilin-type N-terminal cleavage/methylation domain-containing protein [Myxococcota bacterium]
MTRRNIRSSTLALGFSLIEIMVVVAMISILTTMALPRFFEYQARAVRARRKAILPLSVPSLRLSMVREEFIPIIW